MRTLPLIVTLFLLAACVRNAPVPDEEAVRFEVADAYQAYVKALNAGDLDAARAFYDDRDGFHWIERKAVLHESGQAAAAALGDFTAGPGKSVMQIEDMRVAALGPDAAFVSARYTFTAFLPGGEFFEIGGWMSTGMVRRADGWKIAAGMNMD
jgi:ketosteroid isomerase-like protein